MNHQKQADNKVYQIIAAFRQATLVIHTVVDN